MLFFVIGFMTAIAAQNAVGTLWNVVPRSQLVYNHCPRVAGGSLWCTGPGAPR
ncbi:MAG TPA: hypothetical protein VFE17_00655 [Candidatus Baltobacteraceae bacterium]|nr:hypothetical protein [Candidatus Baltobacteraceae bacterium]